MELKPGNWRLSAMYGRLRRAQVEDFNSLQSLDPTLKRMGWGIKFGYTSNDNMESLHVVYFSAFDDESNLDPSALPPFLTPAENSIVSLLATKTIGSKITLEVDYSFSAYSRNKNEVPLADLSAHNFLERIGGLFTPRLSSSFQKALQTTLKFQTNFGHLHLSHERVDPEYRTMGALFFNNDFENITGGTNLRSSNGKWMIHSNVGYQRNNLQKKENNNASRIILALNGTWNANDRISVSAGFSNYRTTQKLRTRSLPFIEADSMVLALVNQNVHTQFTYLMGTSRKNVLTAMIQYQRASAIENDLVRPDQSSSNLLSQMIYNHSFTTTKWMGILQFQLNKTNGSLTNLLTVAPTIGAKKSFFNDKFSSQITTSMVSVYSENTRSATLFQPRVQLRYQADKKSQLSLFSAFITRHNHQQNSFFSEWTSRLEWRVRI
jgi:hypothetical protein